MKPRLRALQKYFTTGTAEAEGNILDSAFVPMEDFLDILSPPFASPRLLVGKKGCGKSAFVNAVKNRFCKSNVPLIILRPKDIHCNWPDDPASLGDLTRHAERAILTAIGSALGSQLEGFVSEDDNKLHKLAQEAGLKDEDFVQKGLKILKPIGKALANIDFDEFAKGLSIKPPELRKLIENQLTSPPRLFYVIIDDTDQLASPAEQNHLNRIWSALLAVRFITEACSHVRCIVTLRTEVWHRMSLCDSGQRDQVDHFRNLIYWLNPKDKDIGKIINRRLDLASIDLGLTLNNNCYKHFFSGDSIKIPTTHDKYRLWSDFIVKRSRERPRDAVQLISALIKTALQSDEDIITNEDLDQTITKYSDERVEDLEREVGEECPQIKEIVRSFAFLEYDDAGFKLKAETLYKHLAGLPGRFGLRFMNKTLQQGRDDENVYTLWPYLHEIGFLGARMHDASQAKGFKHIMLRDDASLVSKERWNQVQTMSWEIHPAYRDYLIAVQQEKALAAESRKAEQKSTLKVDQKGKKTRRHR